jgi:hypothetical protein
VEDNVVVQHTNLSQYTTEDVLFIPIAIGPETYRLAFSCAGNDSSRQVRVFARLVSLKVQVDTNWGGWKGERVQHKNFALSDGKGLKRELPFPLTTVL